jgi:hypothetical protein
MPQAAASCSESRLGQSRRTTGAEHLVCDEKFGKRPGHFVEGPDLVQKGLLVALAITRP